MHPAKSKSGPYFFKQRPDWESKRDTIRHLQNLWKSGSKRRIDELEKAALVYKGLSQNRHLLSY